MLMVGAIVSTSVLFLACIVICVLETVTAGDASGANPGVRTSPEIIAVGSLLLQAAALFATVGGFVLKSGPLLIAATMITVVSMSVATAGFMGEIGDEKSRVSNNRYVGIMLTLFLLGFPVR